MVDTLSPAVRPPVVFYLIGTDNKEVTAGRVVVHKGQNVYLHVQHGYFNHDKTNCPHPVDHWIYPFLRQFGVEWLYHVEVPRKDGSLRRGEQPSRQMMWKAHIMDVRNAPSAAFGDPRYPDRFRWHLPHSAAAGDGGWVGIGPIVETFEHGDNRYIWLRDQGPAVVLRAPLPNRCQRVRIDHQAPLF